MTVHSWQTTIEPWEVDYFYMCSECKVKHRFPRHATEEQSYADGFKCGIEWPDKWESHGKPGGPWVSSCPVSARGNAAWIKGWDVGHRCKLEGKLDAKVTDPEYSFKKRITTPRFKQELNMIDHQIDHATKELNKLLERRAKLLESRDSDV